MHLPWGQKLDKLPWLSFKMTAHITTGEPRIQELNFIVLDATPQKGSLRERFLLVGWGSEELFTDFLGPVS